MAGHAGSRTRIMYVDMTLTRSNIKVNVIDLLRFRKSPRWPRLLVIVMQVGRNKPCMLAAMTVSPLAGLSGY